MSLFRQEQIYAVDGPIERWIGQVPNDDAFKQAESVPNKIDRLTGLEMLNEKYPNQPSILIRIADIYYLLHHISGALDIARHIESIMGGCVNDNIFVEWSKKIAIRVAQENTNNMDMFDRLVNKKEHVYGTSPVFSGWIKNIIHYKHHEPNHIADQIKMTWNEMLNTLTKEQITVAYARLLSIETNQLEDVFLLDRPGHTLTRLVKGGYYLGAFQHVDEASKVTNIRTIVEIIAQVQEALNLINMKSRGKDFIFTSSFVKQIHGIIMKTCRITLYDDKETGFKYPYLIPSGVWRNKTVFVRHHNRTLVFHPFNDIDKSMQMFTAQANAMFCADHSPYTFAAWLHHSLINIHPFEDGNGRVTRLISSIPLLLANYPPICISLENKDKYYEALVDADTTANLEPLATTFAKETLNTLNRIKNIGTSINVNESLMDIDTIAVPYMSKL